MRRLLVLLALFLLAPVGPAPPAGACSCPSNTDEEAFARADVVFVGTLAASGVPSGMTRAVHRFDVTAVHKGPVRRVEEVVTNARGEACGFELTVGDRVLVFADEEGADRPRGAGRYGGSLCNGTRRLDQGAVPTSFGPPLEPFGQGPAAAWPDPADPSPAPVVLAGMASGLLALGAVILFRRHRRRLRRG